MNTIGSRLASGLFVLTLLGSVPGRAGTLDTLIEQTLVANAASARSQKKVDGLHDATSDLASRYRATLEQVESLKVYNRQLQGLIGSQETETEDLKKQIENAASIAREMTPLMLRMLDSLERFVALDVPFLLDERNERLAELRSIMARADVADSEKYRRILEAYQIENEYGRKIEAYRGNVGEGEAQKTVNFLRIGRVVLIYQTLDGKESAAWDQKARAWQPLGSEYNTAIQKGLRVARKQAAPDLVRLPVQAPEAAQ